MLRRLAFFEWRYQARQPVFAAALAFFALMGFVLAATGFGPNSVRVNAPYIVAESLGFLSLFSVFAAAVFVSNAVLRDVEHRMQEIVFATPVGKSAYLVGRFSGAFLATCSALLASVAGMLVGARMPWLAPERVGPTDVLAYVGPFVLMVLPSVLFATAALFAVAAWARSALATYTAAVCIYVLYFVCSALTSSPLMAASTPGAGGGLLPALLDPFGLSSFFEDTRYWTVAEQNARHLAFAGTLAINRALWTAASLAVFGAVARVFTFRVLRSKGRRRPTEPPEEAVAAPEPYAPVAPGRPSSRSSARAFLAAATMEVWLLARNRPVQLLVLLWTALALSEIVSAVRSGEYGSALVPTTALVVGAIAEPLSLVGIAVVIFFSGEVFWRERQARFAAILEATPVSSLASVAAKWTALAALVLLLVVSSVAAGLGVQIAAGYWPEDAWLYGALLVFAGVPLVLLVSAAAIVHALSPNKYLGLVLVLAVALLVERGPVIGLQHNLLRFATAPPVEYSAMNGFDDQIRAFGWFMLLWCLVGGLFLACAAALWRTSALGTAERLRRAARSLGRPAVAAMLALALCASSVAGWIFYNTNVVNAYTTAEQVGDWKAEYEKVYKPIEALPQPRITAVDADVALYPSQRRFRVAGVYELTNETSQAVSQFWVAVRRDADSVSLSAPGARLASSDPRFGMYRLELERPLAPGARTELRFDSVYGRTGFVDAPADDAVVPNGSFVVSLRGFPSIGYRRGYELESERERRRRGLSGNGVAPLESVGEGEGAGDAPAGRVRFAATVSTEADQTVVAPGRLARSWLEAGRRYFRFEADSPMLNQFAIASARYGVAARRVGGVDVEIYYHPEHARNVAAMLDAATTTVDYCVEAFGAYPYGQLRIAEIPSYWEFGAIAMPGTVFFVEDRGFLTDTRDEAGRDLIARRVAHEVAHEWWGYRVVPATAEGGLAITESLAKYTELAVVERMLGPARVRRLLEFEQDRYLRGRSRASEPEAPLLRVRSQPYVYYAKGAIVLRAIRDIVGEEAMNLALRRLVDARAEAVETASSVDLRDALVAAASPEDRPMIASWLDEISLYDFTVESATATPQPDGRYDLALRVAAKRVTTDGAGNESPAPLSEPVEIAVYDAEGHALATRRQVVRTGANDLVLTVAARPTRVAVDPEMLRIDSNRGDNTDVRTHTPR